MLKWLLGLFRKKIIIINVEEVIEIKVPNRYNIRDKKGRFCKKGKENG